MAKTEILSPAVRVKINNEWVELPALKGRKVMLPQQSESVKSEVEALLLL